mmetsp:Transcript_73572/g.192987  ORF Transcript_73572/g.192987 Transcript_73572/m.192987 type:complete len:341 (-) Transcript_73572:12-1034(-)
MASQPGTSGLGREEAVAIHDLTVREVSTEHHLPEAAVPHADNALLRPLADHLREGLRAGPRVLALLGPPPLGQRVPALPLQEGSRQPLAQLALRGPLVARRGPPLRARDVDEDADVGRRVRAQDQGGGLHRAHERACDDELRAPRGGAGGTLARPVRLGLALRRERVVRRPDQLWVHVVPCLRVADKGHPARRGEHLVRRGEDAGACRLLHPAGGTLLLVPDLDQEVLEDAGGRIVTAQARAGGDYRAVALGEPLYDQVRAGPAATVAVLPWPRGVAKPGAEHDLPAARQEELATLSALQHSADWLCATFRSSRAAPHRHGDFAQPRQPRGYYYYYNYYY